MDTVRAQAFVDVEWEQTITPQLVDFIRIPNKSPLYDAKWREHGHMDQAVALVESWCRVQPIRGLTVEIVRIENRTPLILMEIPGQSDETVLLYGHLDKQPEMTGWAHDLGPWTPVLRDEKLYGRGGADDGYAAFASLTAIRAVQEQGQPHARCVVIIEACEESGSYDLPYYMEALAGRIGVPNLVICLDSGCGNYDQLWSTTSLRGVAAGTLTVELLREGIHSGDASGIVADSFRVLRQLLSRVEDEASGALCHEDFYVAVPDDRVQQATRAAAALGDQVFAKFPFLPQVHPIATDTVELILNRTWRPALSVTGAGGLPTLENAGNVCRPLTAVKLSVRLPPTCDADAATARLHELLVRDPPYGARVNFEVEKSCSGWHAPTLAEWLEKSVDRASRTYFGKPAMYMGEGGTIPFMGMLGEQFPQAQFLITGVLGPHSNAHGPNEFLHLPTAKRLTGCVAQVLVDHFRSAGR